MSKKQVIVDYDEYHGMKTIAEHKLKNHSIKWCGWASMEIITNDKLVIELNRKAAESHKGMVNYKEDYYEVSDELKKFKYENRPWYKRIFE